MGPDAHQDEGRHTLAFALYPHGSSLAQSDVVTVARIFNNPVGRREGGQENTLIPTTHQTSVAPVVFQPGSK